MKEAVKTLAEKIAAAGKERAAWEAGRKAFRAEGPAALNPYSPHSPYHALWAEGFDTAREAKRLPVWSEED